jgi:fatty acid desaturase
MGYYADASRDLRRDLAAELPQDELKRLHQKKPVLHFIVVTALFGALAGSTFAILRLDRWYLWLPLAVASGFAIFNFTVLLHEVVHKAVLTSSSPRLYRILGVLYAVPSGISASQFDRWHLDHHAGLGSPTDDPKRHHLSPKINARWLKLLYFTPALFAIYFRAARTEVATYPEELRRRIGLERNLTIILHLTLLAAIVVLAGWFVAWKVYVVPYFFVFPVAFALNRVGQHYDIDPTDPAKWSTLVKGSWFWDVAYLWSNYHLEHHYFPNVPFYNLPRLQKLLTPFYEKRGMIAHGYGYLVWCYVVLNRPPHSNWDAGTGAEPLPAGR